MEEERKKDRGRKKLTVEKGEREGENGLKPLAIERKVEEVRSQV